VHTETDGDRHDDRRDEDAGGACGTDPASPLPATLRAQLASRRRSRDRVRRLRRRT
jgi:hypothetical protein